MTEDAKVVPLLDTEGTPPEVSAMLRHARTHGAPTPAQVARMSAAIAAAVGMPAAGLSGAMPAMGSAPAAPGALSAGASAAPSAAAVAKLAGVQAATAKLGMGLLWKGAALAVGLAAAGAVTYGALKPGSEPVPAQVRTETGASTVSEPAPAVPAAPALEEVEAAAPSEPEAVPVVPAPAPARTEIRTPAQPPAVSKAAPAAQVPGELVLMQRAETQRANPRALLRTLSQLDRLHPGGMLVQEREVLRIEALVKLGRSAEARQVVSRMEKAHPGSPHLVRVRALLADAP